MEGLKGYQRKNTENCQDSVDMSLSDSGRQWGTGKTGVLQSPGSERVGHNLATEQQQQPVSSS